MYNVNLHTPKMSVQYNHKVTQNRPTKQPRQPKALINFKPYPCERTSRRAIVRKMLKGL